MKLLLPSGEGWDEGENIKCSVRCAHDSKATCGSPHRGRVSFFARAKKETKESTPRMAPLSSAPQLWVPALSQRGILPRGPVAHIPVRDPFGALAQSLAVLGCAIRGFKKNPLLPTAPTEQAGRVFEAPVAAAEHRSQNREKGASGFWPPRGVGARRVRRAPILARSARGSRRLRGGGSFGGFSFGKQRKDNPG